jgi:hypothetical protein
LNSKLYFDENSEIEHETESLPFVNKFKDISAMIVEEEKFDKEETELKESVEEEEKLTKKRKSDKKKSDNKKKSVDKKKKK